MTTIEDMAQFSSLIVPRMVDEFVPHVPHPSQQLFLTLTGQEEVFYGGAAGGGKSDALLMAASQYVDVPGYSALILRRTWPDLSQPGAILDRAGSWWRGTSAKMKQGGRIWEFPTSNPEMPARIMFSHLQYDKDKYMYQGAEFTFIAFDELTQFEESTYLYLFSRLRKPKNACLRCGTSLYFGRQSQKWMHKRTPRKGALSGTEVCDYPVPNMVAIQQYTAAPDGTTLFDVPIRMRSASNPGGAGHGWVKERFIDPRTKIDNAVFIPALLPDNPSLDREEYTRSLERLGPVDRERLLRGDWDVMEEGGWFARTWWKLCDYPEQVGRIVQRTRYWDLAASLDGDYTVGALVSVTEDGSYIVEDIVRGRWRPREVEQAIEHTADVDGMGVAIAMEQEPGSSGVNTIDNYSRNILYGYDFRGIKTTGPKEERIRPLSAAVESGNVYIVRANWNIALMDEAELFPNAMNDDQVDAISGALAELALWRRGRVIV